MRLKSLEIEKFGQLKDLKLMGLHPGLTVIFGDNESGKTSLMEFIRSGMFEAGRKTRYPAAQNDDRGRLEFVMDDGSLLHLQRKKNWIGNIDGGPVPGEIFNSMDLNTYEHIFAMDLENLMAHEKITKNNSIKGRFLNVAGAHKLNEAREYCVKETDGLLGMRKSRDSKKPMEKLMAEMDDLETEIRGLQADLDGYKEAKRELQEEESKKTMLQDRLKATERELNGLQKALDNRQNWLRMRELQAWMESLSYAQDFPADGLTSYQKWSDKLDEENDLLHEKESEMDFLQSEIDSYRADDIIAHASRLRRLYGLRERHRSVLENIREYKGRIQEAERDIREAERSLGWANDLRGVILDLELETGLRGIDETLQRVQESLNQIKSLIDAKMDSPLEYAIDPTEWDRLRLLKQHQDERMTLQSEMDAQGARQRLLSLAVLSSSTLSLLSGAILAIQGALYPWGVGFMALAAAGLGYGALLIHRRQLWSSTFSSQWQSLNDRGQQLIDDGMDPSKSWDLQLSRLQETTVLIQKSEDRERRLHELEEQMTALEEERSDALSALSALLRKKGLPPQLNLSQARGSLPLLKGLQKSRDDLDSWRRQLESLCHENHGYEQELEELCLSLGVDCPDYASGTAILMQRLEKAEEEENLQKSRIRDQQKGMKDIKDRQEGVVRLRASIHDLMGDMDSNQFLSKGRDNASHQEAEKELRNLRSSMAASLGGENELLRLIEVLEGSETLEMQERVESLEAELEDLDKERVECIERTTVLKERMEDMRNEEELSRLSQELESKRTEMTAYLKRYARASLSLHLLNEASDKFMREKQPRVIASADHYLEMMTSGRYRMILDPSSMEVTVQSKDGLDRKSDGEWSSGLGDQIHLSLRLSMAEEMSRSESLPLILDDVLVRFDHERRQGAAKAIHVFSQKDGGRQVLLFTCDHATHEMFRGLPQVSFLHMRDGRLQPEKDSLTISA